MPGMFSNWQLLHCTGRSPPLFHINVILNLLCRLIVFARQFAGFHPADDLGKTFGEIEATCPFDTDRSCRDFPRGADFDFKLFPGHICDPLPITDTDFHSAVFRHFFRNNVHVPLFHFCHHTMINILLCHAVH